MTVVREWVKADTDIRATFKYVVNVEYCYHNSTLHRNLDV